MRQCQYLWWYSLLGIINSKLYLGDFLLLALFHEFILCLVLPVTNCSQKPLLEIPKGLHMMNSDKLQETSLQRNVWSELEQAGNSDWNNSIEWLFSAFMISETIFDAIWKGATKAIKVPFLGSIKKKKGDTTSKRSACVSGESVYFNGVGRILNHTMRIQDAC